MVWYSVNYGLVSGKTGVWYWVNNGLVWVNYGLVSGKLWFGIG
jgi:hypothetical protein